MVCTTLQLIIMKVSSVCQISESNFVEIFYVNETVYPFLTALFQKFAFEVFVSRLTCRRCPLFRMRWLFFGLTLKDLFVFMLCMSA
jgi:hypothetical protein